MKTRIFRNLALSTLTLMVAYSTLAWHLSHWMQPTAHITQVNLFITLATFGIIGIVGASRVLYGTTTDVYFQHEKYGETLVINTSMGFVVVMVPVIIYTLIMGFIGLFRTEQFDAVQIWCGLLSAAGTYIIGIFLIGIMNVRRSWFNEPHVTRELRLVTGTRHSA